MKLKQYFRLSLEQYLKRSMGNMFTGVFLSIPVVGGSVEFKVTKKDYLNSLVDSLIKKGEFYDNEGNIITDIDLSDKNGNYKKS